MKTVFVVRLTAIGDTIIAARAFQTLIEHGCNAVFVTHASQKDIVLSIPGLKYAVLFSDKNEIAFYKKQESQFVPCDWSELGSDEAHVLDLQSTSRSKRVIKLLKEKYAVSTSTVSKRTLFRAFLVFCAWISFSQKMREKIKTQIQTIAELQMELVQKYLNKNNIKFNKPASVYLQAKSSALENYVLVFIGASYKLKVWPKEHVRLFIKGVLSNTSYRVVLCGGKIEEHIAHYLAFDDEKRIINLVGKTSLLETLSLAKGANYILSNDSFGAHLADAFQKNAAVVFGATSPQFGFAPRDPHVEIFLCGLKM